MVDWTGDVDDNGDPETDGGDALAQSVIDDINEEEDADIEVTETPDGSDETEDDGDDGTETEACSVDLDSGETEGDDEVDDDEIETKADPEDRPDDESRLTDDDDDEDVTDAIADAAGETADATLADDTAETTDKTVEPDTAATAPSEGSYFTESMLAETAPDAIGRADAAEQDPRWTILVWGDEGTGKSHFAHTAPEPVCYLDTEGKAANLAEKFDKDVVYFDATDYDSAHSALQQSLGLLREVQSAHGVTGTIVVDSMSKMWEFAQQKHVDEHYVTAESPEDVTFKSGLQGGDDWKKIKKYHNARFRDVLAACPFHVVLTAMAEEDYNAVMDGADGKPMKPQGEKNNRYAVENIVRLRAAESGDTVGDLLKTDRTRLRFSGLEWPEFGQVTGYINRISDAEQAAGDVDVDDWDVDVVRGSPAAETADDDDGGDE